MTDFVEKPKYLVLIVFEIHGLVFIWGGAKEFI